METQVDPRLLQLIYGGINNALNSRGLFRELRGGEVQEVQFLGYRVHPHLEAVSFVVDTQRLPKTAPLSKLESSEVIHLISTNLNGRRVIATNSRGLAYTVGLYPSGPQARLPRRVDLDLESRPDGQYMVPIGEGRGGPVWRSLLETGHVLVGGTTGYGKSTWLSAMLVALLSAHGPDELKLAIIDPKTVEFAGYRGLPHLFGDVATDVEPALALTDALLAEVKRREELFRQVGARKLAEYNRRADELLPLVVVLVDEVTEIAMLAGGPRSRFYTNLIRLVSKARALGLVMVLATTNPKAEVINTLIRDNCLTRIAFRAMTADHSRIILDEGGAESLPAKIRGRLVARIAGGGPVVLQGYRVDDEVIAGMVSRWMAGSVQAAEQPPALGDVERELVRVAVEELGGYFVINRLAEMVGGATHHLINKTAGRLEMSGLLTPPQYDSDGRPLGRRVTPGLAAMAGVEMQGEGETHK